MDMGKFKFYLPRVLAILLILFVSVFALDAFSDPDWPFAISAHLVPSFVLLVILAIAWKKEKIGGILFILTGLIAAGFFKNIFAFFLVALPVMVIGILFFWSGRKKSAQG